jgi:hypothetical protein
MQEFRVVEICGLSPERDDATHCFASTSALRTFLDDVARRFSAQIDELRHSHPHHDHNNHGPEYLGVGFVARLRADADKELSVGIAPKHWALVTAAGFDLPVPDSTGPGTLVYFFGDWTELAAEQTLQPESAWRFVESWLGSGADV